MHKRIIILAGGFSSRMKKPITSAQLTEEELEQSNERSKALIGVGADNRPILDYLLHNIKKSGYNQVYILISEKKNMFRDFYGTKEKNNDFHGLNISYAIQYIPKKRSKPYGTADALFQVLEQYPELNDDYYTVCNSDNLYSAEVLYSLREDKHPNAFIAYDRDALLFPKERLSSFALSKLDDEGYLVDIIEKPSLEQIEKYRDSQGKLRVSMNAFKFQGYSFYDYLKNCPPNSIRDEKELPTALLNMVKDHPSTVKGLPFSEHVPDLTSKNDIYTVKEYLATHYKKLNW